jgi:hypothetical protein
MKDDSPRARLNTLLEKLAPGKAELWAEALRLAQDEETWRPPLPKSNWQPDAPLRPLPSHVAHNSWTLAAAQKRLAALLPGSPEHQALASEIAVAEAHQPAKSFRVSPPPGHARGDRA